MEEKNIRNTELQRRNTADRGFFGAMSYLLIGGGIGVAVALLFAPKSGSEFRGDIADATRKGYDLSLEKAVEFKAKSAEALESVKEKVVNVYDLASAKLSQEGEMISDLVLGKTGDAAEAGAPKQNDSGNTSKRSGNGQRSSSIV